MSAETILDLFLWLMLAAALVGAIVAVIVVHLFSMRVTKRAMDNSWIEPDMHQASGGFNWRQALADLDKLNNSTSPVNGIDLFAEHHGMHRKSGESDDELIARVKRGNPVV